MGLKNFCSVGRLLLMIIGLTWAQEDSLRSALNAIDRRQKDLSEFSRYDDDSLGEYGYSLDGPDDLAFLSPSDYNSDRDLEKNSALERLLLDYLEDGSYLDSGRFNHDEDVRKRISSSFRERLEEDKERQLEELAQSFLTENDRQSDEDYNELIRELWEKYRNYPNLYNRPRVYLNENKKRAYYPRWGLDSVGLRKRSKFYDSDSDTFKYRVPREEFYNRYQDDDDRSIESNYYDWAAKHYKRDRKYDSRQRSYNYPVKRFPVSKRSSGFEPPHSEITHEQKRSTTKKDSVDKTDPKVAKDLSNIFGTVSTEKPPVTVKLEKSKSVKKEQAKDTKQKTKPEKNEKTEPANSKEEISTVVGDKPLQIQKKSIDWSDYFGFDRRKKSDDELDNEWLIERYHKAIALKRKAEYPLQSFKNHDQLSKKESDTSPDSHKKDTDDVKISEMDAKLKNMEDTIIDDALKYTGAHDGSTDSQEIQEVKDRVISRLAAAYSLEKMRRALGEYKLNLAKEKERLKQQHKNNDDYDISEEKRVSVPRKQAIDEDREKTVEADNNVKCSQGDEDCEEQNYRTPSEVLEQTVFEECPRVQRACSEIATVLGHYARVFETACNMHQMCLLCSNNSWFAPTRQCNVLFLTKAFELCDGKQECQKEAQRSVRYLLDVNRSLRLEPLGECELACPDRR